VRIRDGRATVSGEPLEFTADHRREGLEHEGDDPQVRRLSRTRNHQPREKGRSYVKYSVVAPCAFVVFVASVAVGVAAPEPSPSPSPSGSPGLREIGQVVTSDRRSEPIGQTSRPTFVVDRAQIDAYGARTVADALQGVPGVELFSYGPFGAEVDYGLRGATSERTLVLVDGIPVTDPTTGSVQLGQLSTIGVERIEVVESGSSTLYGTSASGGVINVITSVPRNVYVEASEGSYADRDVRVGAGNGTIGFTLERHVSNGDFAYPEISYGPNTTCDFGFLTPCKFAAGVRTPAYGDQSAGRLSLDTPVVDGFRVSARIDSSSTQIGVPGGLDFLTPTASEGDLANSALLEISRASSNATFTLDLGGSQTRLDYVDPVNNYGESDTYTGRSQISLREVLTGTRVDAVVGADFSRESGIFTTPTTPNFSSPSAPPIPASALGSAESQSAAYVQLGSSPIAGTRFTAGLRAENDAPHGTVLAPSFGGTIRAGTIRFAGNVGESFRVPTLEDRYYPGFSNPNLLPEKAQTADTTVSYDAPNGTLTAGWFDRNGSNFIVDGPAPYYLPENAQRAAVAGLQVTASTKPRDGFTVEASYTDLYRSLDLVTGARLPRNPNGSATLSLVHPFARTRFNYGLRWDIVGSDGDDRANVTPAPLSATYDAYDSLDAFLRYKLASNAIVTVRGFNLGNEFAAPIFGYPAPGRRLYVELSTR
jgi:vitamin B12 transporter